MSELKPCPFCGASATLHYGMSEVWVRCDSCDCSTRMHTDVEKAIAAWNTRTPDTSTKRTPVGCGDGDTYIVDSVPYVKPDTSAKVDVEARHDKMLQILQLIQEWAMDETWEPPYRIRMILDVLKTLHRELKSAALQAPRSDTSGVELLSGADLEMHIYAQYHNEYGHFPEEHGNTSKHDYSAFKRGYKLAMATKAEQWLKKQGA